ncbi:MAG: hypothetical protein WEG40_13975 [Candidatus Rokuibacteriota bacterium]
MPANALRTVQLNTKSPRFHVPDYARVEVGREGRITAGPDAVSLGKGTRLVVLDLKVSGDRMRLFTHTLAPVPLPDGKVGHGCTEFVFAFDPDTLARADTGTVAGGSTRCSPATRMAEKEDRDMMQMTDMNCGPLMMVMGGLSWLLGLGLVGSLTVLVWVVIGRLRRTPTAA